MNYKSKPDFKMSKAEFQQILEEQERLSEKDALKQFVKKPKESNLSDDKTISTVDFCLLFILLCVIFVVSVITDVNGEWSDYISALTAILALIGIVILIKDAKKNDDKNNK